MGIFDKRVVFKPFEYPEVLEYKNAINHSYWLVGEWNFIGDVQDFNVRLSKVEKLIIKNALLAISQIEISVKRFWTKLGDRFPKAEFEQVGVTFGECHVDGTQTLTPKGWVDFADINIGDDVIQFHPDNTFSITKVKAKFEKPYEGDLYNFYKKTTSTYVTPNHRIVHYNHKEEYCESTALQFQIKNNSIKIPEAGKMRGGKTTALSFMDRLRIALQADGHRRYYNNGSVKYAVGLKKERKIKKLDWILENLDESVVKFTKRKAKSEDRKGYFYYTIQIDNLYNYKEFDWVNLYDKSSQWCEEFIQEVGNWDSTRHKGKKDCLIKFGSSNKRAIDAVQMVGVAAGYRTNIYPSKKDGHVLSFTSNRARTTISPLKLRKIAYNGLVRCITVDSGAIITRYNDKTFIAGNSEVRHSDAYSHLLQILGFNDDFALLLQNPVIQGRVDYLTKYLKGASDNSNENYTLTLTLFSLFIENVSLFSQFLIIKSFNKYRNILKDVDNVVQATQQEEFIHAMFGIALIKIIQKEQPDWFNEDFFNKLYRACKKAYEAECNIIDWIFEAGELDFLGKNMVKEFVKNRFNDSLEMIGGKKIFEVDTDSLVPLKWFEEEIHAEVSTDFFHKKPVSYSKKMQAINAEDIF